MTDYTTLSSELSVAGFQHTDQKLVLCGMNIVKTSFYAIHLAVMLFPVFPIMTSISLSMAPF